MKKKIKTFVSRLRDAWSIIRGHCCVFILYEDDTSEQEVDRTTTALLGARWLRNNGNVNYFSRADMLLDLLNDTNSIMISGKGGKTMQMSLFDDKDDKADEIMNILKDVNIEATSPVQAFAILMDLKEKASK